VKRQAAGTIGVGEQSGGGERARTGARAAPFPAFGSLLRGRPRPAGGGRRAGLRRGRPGRNARGGRKPAPNVQAGASRRVAKAKRCPRPCGRREAPSVTGARWSGGSRGTWTTAPRGVGRASGEPGSRPMLPRGQYRPAPIAVPTRRNPGAARSGRWAGDPDKARAPRTRSRDSAGRATAFSRPSVPVVVQEGKMGKRARTIEV